MARRILCPRCLPVRFGKGFLISCLQGGCRVRGAAGAPADVWQDRSPISLQQQQSLRPFQMCSRKGVGKISCDDVVPFWDYPIAETL